jgi:hypothetical protein
MQMIKKVTASAVTVGLLAFGAVVGVGGAALASPVPYVLITGCEAQVATVTLGFGPNCEAIGGSTGNPTTIFIDLDTDNLSALIGDQEGQAMDASWTLSCLVNGAAVNVPGSYDVTSTSQAPYTTIDLQAAVGSPEPTRCTIENLKVHTALPLNASDLELTPFIVGVIAIAVTASPGSIYQDEGRTGAGARAALCADDTANGNAGSRIQGFQCLSDLADSFVRTASGQLVHNGDCVGLSGSKVVLATCVASDTAQEWVQTEVGGTVMNQSTGTCLTAPAVKNATKLTAASCGSGANQKWHLPAKSAAPIVPCAAFRFAKTVC